MHARTRAFVEVTAAVLVWGASFAATKVALRQVSPVTVVWLRFAMGIAVLGAAAAWRGELRRVSARDLGIFASLGLIGITLHQWLQSTALQTTHASTGGWVAAATPVCIALVAALVLRERLTRLQWVGIVVATLGVVLIVTDGAPAMLLAGRFAEPGDILMVLSAPNWAVFSVLSRRVLRDHPPARMIFYTMTMGWLMTSVLFVAAGKPAEIGRLTSTGWLAVGFLGIFCSGLAYIFWYDALHSAPTSQVGTFLYLEPLVAVVTGMMFQGERLLLSSIVGGAIILAGVWLVNREPLAEASA